MLTAHPPSVRPGEDRTMTAMLRKAREWAPGLVFSCAAFHLIVGFVLAFAPEEMLVDDLTQPVFDLLSPNVWAIVFVTLGVLVYCLFARVHRLSSIAIRTAVLFVAGTWITTFALAVFRGEGNAIGVVVWPFLYGPWLAAMRSLGKR
jgi:hypothetical protein